MKVGKYESGKVEKCESVKSEGLMCFDFTLSYLATFTLFCAAKLPARHRREKGDGVAVFELGFVGR
jgi:hypothetical protein